MQRLTNIYASNLKALFLFTVLSFFLVGCSPSDTDSTTQSQPDASQTAGVLLSSSHAGNKPKLILQITVDQFRGDLPTRYYDRLGEGGLRYLLDKGVVYNNAHHAHANTETIVGHATLATGAHPSVHGMIGNIWFDRSTGVTTYNIEDPNYKLLTEGADIDDSTEIDPTQKAASSDGRSPASFLVTTFSDELFSLTAGKAKVFGISVKDRGAVSMAGHS